MKKGSPRSKRVATPLATSPWASPLWYLAMALTAWSFGYTIMRGSDLWWHIAGGRWMVQNGSLWVRDPYSFTAAGQYWLNDAWLSDVLLYLWVQAFGMESLAVWKWALMVVTWVLLFRLLTRVSGERLASYAAATLGLAVAAPFLDVRPQLYSFLCWVILLEGALGRPQPKAWLPLVMLVWVNLHASFVLGLLTLPLLLLPPFWTGRERRSLLLIGGGCLLACLINPNGAEVVLRPFRYALDPSSPFRTLGEWLPPFEPGGIRSWIYPYAITSFAIAVLMVLGDDERRRQPQTWVQIGIGSLALAMSLRSRRFVPFFGIAQSLVAAQALAPLAAALRRRLPEVGPALAAIALSLIWLAPFPRSLYAFDYMTAVYEFPVETANFIETNQLSGKLFALYNWGGYIHLRTGGRLKVFIDGRSETVYSDDTFLQYMRVLREESGWPGVIERSGADFVLWPRRQPNIAKSLIDGGRWRLLYRDYQSILLVRADLPTSVPILPPESAYQLLSIGFEELQLRKPTEAQRSLERALAIQPHLQPACTSLVQAQLLAGDSGAAQTTSERCRRLYPNPERDHFLRTLLASASGRPAS